MFKNNLELVLASWIFVIIFMAVARHRTRTAGSGLVLAYILNLWIIHWAASFLYILPWYDGPDRVATIAGTEQSFYAVAAFAFGSLAISPFVVQSGILPRSTGEHEFDPRLPWTYALVGMFIFFLRSTPVAQIPSASAVLSAGQQLIMVGLALCWWQAWRQGDRKKMLLFLLLASGMPIFTTITGGFLGYGVVAVIFFLVFISNFLRSKVRIFVIASILGYVGLSVYVTYMRDRDEIRRSVWGGDSLSDRISRISQTASTFEFFDLHNRQHLARIEDRMNQSALVGAAVIHLEETKDYAYGETLYDAILALIPRALWSDKTIMAGSGDLVSRFTGIHFLTGGGQTSIGIGSVMEMYVNFGTMGVVVGFIFLGILVTTLDVLATERLANLDLNGFVLFYLPGLAFVQVGGQFVEVTASAAGAIIIALIVNKYLHRHQRQKFQPPPSVPGLPGVSSPFHQNT